MREIDVQPVALSRLTALLSQERLSLMREAAERAHGVLSGRCVWNVNATAQGGGVAEMLQTLLSYTRAAGVDTRWLVLEGDADFFALTKRLHNHLHGSAGDGGPLGEAERRHYSEVLETNLTRLLPRVRPDDVVVLHDPQTAGLVRGLRDTGVTVVWRCHIGSDRSDAHTRRGWAFLRPFVERADCFIFSRATYAPDWLPWDRLAVVPPSIDPFSVKNATMTRPEAAEVLARVGLVDATPGREGPAFVRRDGTPGTVRAHEGLVLDGEPPPAGAPTVVQVSRWDRLKDMGGVLEGFARGLDRFPPDTHLVLVGPEVAGVSDDPEGAQVLDECRARWRDLPRGDRARVHLATVPMDDVDENAHIVNAVQTHASVIAQKSLMEGFGLTVTEAMWKARPVVASAVGGIQDQIVDRRDGLLLHDPRDLDLFAGLLGQVLADAEMASGLGAAARRRVEDRYLGDRHLLQYAELFTALLRDRPPAGT